MNPSSRAGTARRTGGAYYSYLVRLWQDEEQATWRAMTQSVQSGETRHFADLETLFAFLRAQTIGKGQSASASVNKPEP